jgi:hypothetical protein
VGDCGANGADNQKPCSTLPPYNTATHAGLGHYANEKDSLGRAPPLPNTFSCSSLALRFSSRFLALSASISFCFSSSWRNLRARTFVQVSNGSARTETRRAMRPAL